MLRLTSSLTIFLFFSDKNLNVIGQLLNDNGNIKSWDEMKIELKYTGYKLLMLCQGRIF